MNINAYIQQVSDESDWMDKDLCALLDGKIDTTLAAEMWASIASGEADVLTTLLWVQHVANQIQKTVVKGDARDAAPAALKAIGFFGGIERYRAAREYMALVREFCVISEDSEAIPLKQLTCTEWVRTLRAHGHLIGVNDKTAANRVSEWLKEFDEEELEGSR
ncbi:MAG: hypothetical protein WCJ69_17250 [Betaproteobacteria bacterium]